MNRTGTFTAVTLENGKMQFERRCECSHSNQIDTNIKTPLRHTMKLANMPHIRLDGREGNEGGWGGARLKSI